METPARVACHPDGRERTALRNLALRVAHHFYLMEQGRVTFSGNPGELAEDEVIKRAYLGTRRSAG